MPSIRVILTAAALAAFSGMTAGQVAADTSFTYQGRLTDNGGTPTGTYDFKFELFDVASGGVALSTQPADDVSVASGLFTTTLNFGPQFGLQKRWLQISVRPGASSGAYTTLGTRQAITGAPYSIGPWGPTAAGPTCFSGDNSYVTIDKDYGNIHANGGNDGTFGIFSEGPASGSFAIVTANTARLTVKNDSGNVGIGTTNPVYKLSVVTGAGDIAVFGQSDGNGYGGDFFHNTTGNQVFLAGPNQGLYSSSVNGRGIEGWSTNNVAISGDCTSAGTYGQLGTPNEGVFASGGLTRRGLTAGSGIEDGIVTSSTGIGKSGIAAFSNHGSGYGGYFRNNAGGVALWADGLAQVKTLQILGGSDLAEPFDVNRASASDSTQVLPGMVVVIDSEQAGQLRLADSPYDTKVAGIISGANDLAPGMIMRAQGQDMADGKFPVAMTGRVWCWVDASFGSVSLGDRLTTSATPGHAMKAGDSARTGGAVIGKAMTELKEGKGLVLVLVNLQ